MPPVKFKYLVTIVLGLLIAGRLSAQTVNFSGTVLEKNGGAPVEFATVVLEGSGQWAVADEKGKFTIKSVQPGKAVVSVSCLGYVTETKEVTITRDLVLKVYLKADNLALESAVVTAQDNGSMATTSRTIDKTALDHVQIMNVSDISSLLPGGATTNPTLTSEQTFNLRAGTGESGNSSFGTAVEVDGVRLSGNASFSSLKGVSTNNIASANVESVEVITGVPSVEYGDMTSGVVRINTRKGKTPWTVTMSTSPNTKQVSFSKGFGLGNTAKGRSCGVLNVSAEYTNSVSKQMSPYTSYDRKQLSMTYSNTLNSGILESKPLRISAGFTGNLGGLNDKADPDKQVGTWSKTRDNALRGNFKADWLLSKSWITNVEMEASVSFNDRFQEENNAYSSATSTSSLHAIQAGYYMSGSEGVTQIAPGYWYSAMCVDDKPLASKIGFKANWAHNFGKVNNKLKFGADWSADKNLGVGQFARDLSTAPSYREYRYCDVPLMSNVAAYLEDNVMIPIGAHGRLNLIAGLRSDNTIIPGSAYGVTSSLSPRFNAKYTAFSAQDRKDAFLRGLAFRASWGIAVKQPSYSVLYPTPSYLDLDVFTSTAASDNTLYRAYYVMPRTIEYNSGLRWQKSRQAEVGVEVDLAGNKISLAAYRNRTLDSYYLQTSYTSFSYNYTPITATQDSAIPSVDRIYSIDHTTGVVTITDRTGAHPSETIQGTARRRYVSSSMETNSQSPIDRMGLEWVMDFKKIRPISTSIRLDGSWYSYRTLTSDMIAYCPATLSSYDGTPYKYVGYYYGGNSVSNGMETRSLRTNLTLTTNIPKVRMIVSMKLESSLVKYTRYLSERADGSARSHVLSDASDILATTDDSIYDGEHYVIMYPDTYTVAGDTTPHDYLADLKAAKASGNSELYADLSKLAVRSSYLYYFNEDNITPYFCANFSVTKEIGDLASISFYANNFFNNQSQVYSSRTGNYVSVTSYIPKFYYGLTLRLKFN